MTTSNLGLNSATQANRKLIKKISSLILFSMLPSLIALNGVISPAKSGERVEMCKRLIMNQYGMFNDYYDCDNP